MRRAHYVTILLCLINILVGLHPPIDIASYFDFIVSGVGIFVVILHGIMEKQNKLQQEQKMKFRTKPVTKEAWPIAEILQSAKNKWSNLPPVVAGAYERGEIIFLDGKISIKTLEGWMNADKDSWLICGLHNELYACDPYIFEKTYEKVEE